MRTGFRLRYEPSFDGVRAVGVLLVFAHHAAVPGVHGGAQGVTMFFVLSGFLITSILLAEHEDLGGIGLGRFYARRALRLLPALGALLVFTTGWALFAEHGPGRTALLRDVGFTAVYVQNISLGLRHLDTTWGLLGHCWSLAVEEQFYLLWPLTLLALTRLPLSRRTIVLVVGAGAVVLATWRAVLAASHPYLLWPHVALDTRGDALLLGCALGMACTWGLVAVDGATRSRLRSAAAVVAGVALVVWALPGQSWERTSAYSGDALVAVLTAVLLFDLVRSADSPMRRLLSLRPLVLLGRISYAFYLWHFFIVVWLREHWSWAEPGYTARYGAFLVVGLAASTAAAAASMRFVEAPFLRRKARFERAAVEPAPTPVVATATPGALPTVP